MAKRKRSVDVARAWKDPEYRASLSPEELAQLPGNPAGDSELDPSKLDEVSGGNYPKTKSLCCWPTIAYCKSLWQKCGKK